MRQSLTVHIPQNQDVSYSLYAYGSKIAVPTLSDWMHFSNSLPFKMNITSSPSRFLFWYRLASVSQYAKTKQTAIETLLEYESRLLF